MVDFLTFRLVCANVRVGWGTDENMIITILGHRNAAQRNLIRQAYAEKYGEDLLKSLNDELSQDFLVCILS